MEHQTSDVRDRTSDISLQSKINMEFNPKQQYKQYKASKEELSTFELSTGTWFTRNKLVLKKIGIIALAVIAGVFTLIAVISWIRYLAFYWS